MDYYLRSIACEAVAARLRDAKQTFTPVRGGEEAYIPAGRPRRKARGMGGHGAEKRRAKCEAGGQVFHRVDYTILECISPLKTGQPKPSPISQGSLIEIATCLIIYTPPKFCRCYSAARRSADADGSPDGDQVVSDAPPPAPTYAAASRSSAS